MKKDKVSAKSIVTKQTEDFVKILKAANEKRKVARTTEDYIYIESFFKKVISDRNKRADEIDSKEFSEAINIANKIFPYPTYLENCMDGRLFGPLIGLYGHIGDVLSVAGGILYEFVRDENQKIRLIHNSNFGQLLKKYLSQEKVTGIVEILDSHVGCAARGAEEIAKGKDPKDQGLLTDVIQKMEMCDAIKEFVNSLYKGQKEIFPINISADPQDGFIYMGLATTRSINYAMENEGFTKEVLKYLTEKGYIISSKSLAEDKRIERVFKKHEFNIDITHSYKESAIRIWKNIDSMKEELLPIIFEKLKKVYPHMKDDPKKQKELLERAIILLINAFTGYLHKRFYNTYPYAEHHEEGVFVSKGNNPPYEVALFGESSLDMNNLPSNIDLASSIVRNNRKVYRVEDDLKIFKDLKNFVAAPVGVIMQVKVLDELPEEEWNKLLKVDWFDLEKVAWENMNDSDFLNYLEDKVGSIPLCVANAVNKLRKRIAILYDMDEAIAGRLIDHDIIVLPIISDVSKRVRFIIPFIKTGFK